MLSARSTIPTTTLGPGTGYRVSEARRQEINAIRDVLDRREVLRAEVDLRPRRARGGIPLPRSLVAAEVGSDPDEVVIGVSPAFGLKLFRTLAGIR